MGSLTLSSSSLFSLPSLKPTPLTILFQGDSITDGNRGRSSDPNHVLGHGYAFAIASRLGAEFPERNLTFINRGVSGNTVAALNERWTTDALDLKPDVLSILIGVNDVLFGMKSGNRISGFEEELRTLLQATRKGLPNTKLVLIEPFILSVGMVKENPERWSNEMATIQGAIRKLAAEFDCIHLPLQQTFTNALERAPADYWIWDGIHPTVSGHGLMAIEWMKKVGKIIPALGLT